jgi:aminoglycoside phosphotransferase family enzyme
MPCEQRERLLEEYDKATEILNRYAESMKDIKQSYKDVQNRQQLQRIQHEKSAALQEHEKTHGCRLAETK